MFNKILRNGEYASSAAQQGLTLGWADETEGIAGGVGYGIGSLNKKWNKTGETFGQALNADILKHVMQGVLIWKKGIKEIRL